QFFIIRTDKIIIFLVIIPIGCVKSVILIFLFLFFTVMVIRNQWRAFSILHDIFIVLFTTITCVSYNIFRQLKVLFLDVIQERNECTCVRWVWKHIISKRILPFCRKLYIIACF